MAESAHYHQLGKFVVLFQRLESSLIEIIDLIADEDCAVEILPAETEYRRLVESTEVIFSRFVDLMRQPDLEAKTRFHHLMQQCLDIGVLRNRLIHSTYALLERPRDAVAPVPAKGTLKFKGTWRRESAGGNLPLESFEPYFEQLAKVLAQIESFRLQVIAWKYPEA